MVLNNETHPFFKAHTWPAREGNELTDISMSLTRRNSLLSPSTDALDAGQTRADADIDLLRHALLERHLENEA